MSFDGTYPTAPNVVATLDENGKAETIEVFDDIPVPIQQMSPVKEFLYMEEPCGLVTVQFDGRFVVSLSDRLLSSIYARTVNEKELAALVYGYILWKSNKFPLMINSGESIHNLLQLLDSAMAGSTMEEFA